MSHRNYYHFCLQARSNPRREHDIDGRKVDELEIIRDAVAAANKKRDIQMDAPHLASEMLAMFERDEWPPKEMWVFNEQLLNAVAESDGKKLDLRKLGKPQDKRRREGRPSTVGLPPSQTGGVASAGYRVAEKISKLMIEEAMPLTKARTHAAEYFKRNELDVWKYWKQNKHLFDLEAADERFRDEIGHQIEGQSPFDVLKESYEWRLRLVAAVEQLRNTDSTVEFHIELTGDYPMRFDLTLPPKQYHYIFDSNSPHSSQSTLVDSIYAVVEPCDGEISRDYFLEASEQLSVFHRLVELVSHVAERGIEGGTE